MQYRPRILAPGPTPVPESARLTMAERNPYHRTEQFSAVLRRIRERLQRILNREGPVVLVNGSGTAGMELAVQSLVEPEDRVLVVETGKFGRRWSGILRSRGAEVDVVEVEPGETVRPDIVRERLTAGSYRALFSTLVETSTLVRHPVEDLLEESSDLYHVVDAISGLGAEPFDPDAAGADAVIGGSQKGFMAPPGLSFVGFSDRGARRAKQVDSGSFYLDGRAHLERLEADSQTPWTPSMNLIRSLETCLDQLEREGLEDARERHRRLASTCRSAVEAMGLDLFGEHNSVVGTPVKLPDDLADGSLQQTIHEEYNLYVPGGQQELAGRLLRIGHLGYVDYFDLLAGLAALEQGLLRADWTLAPGDGLTAAQQTWERLN